MKIFIQFLVIILTGFISLQPITEKNIFSEWISIYNGDIYRLSISKNDSYAFIICSGDKNINLEIKDLKINFKDSSLSFDVFDRQFKNLLFKGIGVIGKNSGCIKIKISNEKEIELFNLDFYNEETIIKKINISRAIMNNQLEADQPVEIISNPK